MVPYYRKRMDSGEWSEKKPLGWLGVLLVAVTFYAIIVTPCAWMWDYSVSHVLTWLGKKDTFEMWPHGYILALIPGLGQLVIPITLAISILGIFI